MTKTEQKIYEELKRLALEHGTSKPEPTFKGLDDLSLGMKVGELTVYSAGTQGKSMFQILKSRPRTDQDRFKLLVRNLRLREEQKP